MEQVGLPNRLNVYFAFNPLGALFCDGLLLEPITEGKLFIFNSECLLACPIGIEPFNKPWFTEEEIEMINALELFLELLESIDREVGRNN